MGISINFQTNTEQECPYSFTRTDGKSFYHRVMAQVWGSADPPDYLAQILTYTALSIAPLGKIAGEEWTLEDYQQWHSDATPAEIQIRWQRDSAKNTAAWQTPQAIRMCVEPLISVLEQQPSILENLGIQEGYFTDGLFLQDLLDVQSMAVWAEQKGITLVRFLVS